jgi:carbon monoxide dehydrogenase subunit G
MVKFVVEILVAIVGLVAPLLASSAPAAGGEVVVHATRDGATFTVDAEFAVAADVDQTWEVLTDFDRMAQIVSSVDASRIVSRDGNLIEVAQKSHANAGLLHVSMESVRQVELKPKREIHSRLLKGDLKSSDFTTSLSDEGGTTKVAVHGTFVAGGLSAGAINVESVEAQTRRQYQELRDEILRRKAGEPPPPCLIAKTCQQRGSG